MAEHTEQQLRAIAVLHARGRDHHAEEQAVGIGQGVAFAALDLFAGIVAAAQRRELPAFDALTVDDRAPGLGFFFSAWRESVRKASFMRGHKPALVQAEKASCTVFRGGNSRGNSAHWQPVWST